jgi:hypothetical protein
LEIAEAFGQELRRVILGLRWRPDTYVFLLDARGRTVQSQQVTEYVRQHLMHDSAIKPQRIAVLADGGLVGMQAKRLNTATRMTFFTEEEALSWLLSDSSTPESA